MSDKIFIAGYWPYFNTSEWRRFDYTAVDGSMEPITSVFSYDPQTNSMLYDDYDGHGVWKDRWFYQYRAGFGIAEWRDDYPGGKKVVMNPPIGWGNLQEVGSDYINYPAMDPFKCWPPAFAKGTQCVHYEAKLTNFLVESGIVYNDVLQFTYLQSWDGKPATGARYWMALGIGPVAVQWIAQDPNDRSKLIETARMDAVVTSYNNLTS
jgi:hypothetical protein